MTPIFTIKIGTPPHYFNSPLKKRAVNGFWKRNRTDLRIAGPQHSYAAAFLCRSPRDNRSVFVGWDSPRTGSNRFIRSIHSFNPLTALSIQPEHSSLARITAVTGFVREIA